jgi:hypothetical protein
MIFRLIEYMKTRAGHLFIAWFVGILVLSVLPIGKAKAFEIRILEIRVGPADFSGRRTGAEVNKVRCYRV